MDQNANKKQADDNLKTICDKQHALLDRAGKEIELLRRANRELELRTRVFDDMMKIFNAEPPRYGMAHNGDDILYLISTHLKK